MQITLRRGAYNGDRVTFTCAEFDFTSAVSGTDYSGLTRTAATMSTTGEDVYILGFAVPLAGMDLLYGYDDDPDSDQNLAKNWMITVSNAVAYLGDAVPVDVGVKPADWEAAWRYKYYTRRQRTAANFSGQYAYDYIPVSSTYSSTTQYYTIDGAQNVYYTDGQGFFGVSVGAYAATYFLGQYDIITCYQALLRGFDPYTPDVDASNPFYWRSGGAAGSVLSTLSGVPATATDLQPTITADDQTISGRYLMQLCHCRYDDDDYIGIIIITVPQDGIPQSALFRGVTYPFWRPENPRINYGSASGINFGSGTFSDPSTPVLIPSIPSALTATDLGAGMHIRLLSVSADVPALFSQLWSTTGFWSKWQNLRFDPLSAIVSLHLIPTQISGTSVSSLSIALTRLNVGNIIPPSRIIDMDRGTVQVPEYYGNRLDYAATQASIYLPFIGDYPLDIMDVMGGSLSLTYRIDIATGDCIAFLLGTDRRGLTTISKQYKGNCAFRLPISGSDNGGAGLMAALSAILGGTVGLATGNAVGGAAEIIGGALQAATAPVNTTAPAVQGSASSMGVLTPYVKIYRAAQVRPDRYGDLIGDTSDIGGTVAMTSDGYTVTGYTQYADVKLDIAATDAEISEIRTLLQGGIYL